MGATWSNADAHRWGCPKGRSAWVRNHQSLHTHIPQPGWGLQSLLLQPLHHSALVPFPYIVPWVPQSLQSKFCSQMADTWDGLVPWNRSRSFAPFDWLSFFIFSFCLETQKKKKKTVILVQTRTISQLNSSCFWVMEEQWHKPLSVGLLPALHFCWYPAAQLAPASKTKSSQHHYGPQLYTTWESKETNISWLGIGQSSCYINPEYINMIIKLSCMKPQWRLYNLCPYLYRKKKKSLLLFFLTPMWKRLKLKEQTWNTKVQLWWRKKFYFLKNTSKNHTHILLGIKVSFLHTQKNTEATPTTQSQREEPQSPGRTAPGSLSLREPGFGAVINLGHQLDLGREIGDSLTSAGLLNLAAPNVDYGGQQLRKYQSSHTVRIMKQNKYKPLKNVPKCWVLDPLQLLDAVIFHCLLKQPLDFSILLGIVAEPYQLNNFKAPQTRYHWE